MRKSIIFFIILVFLCSFIISAAADSNMPPSTISNLGFSARNYNWIRWTWTNPSDSDFGAAIIFINNVNVANTSNNFYNATPLNCGTLYYLVIITKDNSGNINYTNIYLFTSTTACPNTVPPGSVTELTSSEQGDARIKWTWKNPTDSDFDYSIVYLNGANIANTSNNYYNATGLSCERNYTITINTKDIFGNINSANLSLTASTTQCRCGNEGEEYSSTGAIRRCCAGLTEWMSGTDTRISVADQCYETGIVSGNHIGRCIKCGDGICIGRENPCNCLNDCAGKGMSTYKTVEEFCRGGYSTYCNIANPSSLSVCRLCLGGAYCGNGNCDNGESCSSCPQDCGSCGGGEEVTGGGGGGEVPDVGGGGGEQPSGGGGGGPSGGGGGSPGGGGGPKEGEPEGGEIEQYLGDGGGQGLGDLANQPQEQPAPEEKTPEKAINDLIDSKDTLVGVVEPIQEETPKIEIKIDDNCGGWEQSKKDAEDKFKEVDEKMLCNGTQCANPKGLGFSVCYATYHKSEYSEPKKEGEGLTIPSGPTITVFFLIDWITGNFFNIMGMATTDSEPSSCEANKERFKTEWDKALKQCTTDLENCIPSKVLNEWDKQYHCKTKTGTLLTTCQEKAKECTKALTSTDEVEGVIIKGVDTENSLRLSSFEKGKTKAINALKTKSDAKSVPKGEVEAYGTILAKWGAPEAFNGLTTEQTSNPPMPKQVQAEVLAKAVGQYGITSVRQPAGAEVAHLEPRISDFIISSNLKRLSPNNQRRGTLVGQPPRGEFIMYETVAPKTR